MTKLPKIIILFALLITSGCREQSGGEDYSEELTLAENMLETRPDSALSILCGINIDSISDPIQAAKAHYLHGTTKLRLWDYCGAITPLLYAEKYSESTHNHRLTGMARERIMELYDSIDNLTATVRYTLKAADAYRECNDTVKQLELLGSIVMPLFSLEDTITFNSVAATMKSLSININDSTLLASVKMAESWSFILSDILRTNPQSRYFDPENLHDSIFSGRNWKDLILGENHETIFPSTIYILCSELREKEMYALAKELESTYLDKYTVHRYGESLMTNRHRFSHEAYYAIPLTRESFLSEYLPSVERSAIDFYYNETVIKEQTIRHQHEIMITTIIGCVLVICIIILIFHNINGRRRRREEILIQSAAELKTSLSDTNDKWLGTLTNLCDTYYDAYVKQSAKSKIAKAALDEINRAIDDPDFFPSLEQRLNNECDGLMSRLREEMPELRDDEYILFMLNALGFSIPTIALLTRESRDLIYTRRVRLRSKIQECTPAHSEQFLKALE